MNAFIRTNILPIIMAAASIYSAHADLLLADREKALSEVVIPAEASPTVQHAAEELARYLEQISTVAFSVVAEDKRTELLSLEAVDLTSCLKRSWSI